MDEREKRVEERLQAQYKAHYSGSNMSFDEFKARKRNGLIVQLIVWVTIVVFAAGAILAYFLR